MIDQMKQDLQKMTYGADWTNFDDREHSKVVYEYDRLTESTCAIIAECQTVEMAQFIADYPERLRYLIGEHEKSERVNRGLGGICDSLQAEAKRLEGEVEELRKALEGLVEEIGHDPNHVDSKEFGKAVQALERSNP